ncbi:hypothetical protein CHS0354_017114 [Potamilus streckersoni]|uniref:TLC domain-containing protein n=1 Tax=Potamilus streckersoni TaxID=2493646 RepID=A0AAE0SC41_9BIVA|nr:hypothetical protein CHS0354_017114 [Potamilus streckersoni]
MSADKLVEEIWPDEVSGAKYGFFVVGLSALFFALLSWFSLLTRPKIAINEWRWKNISISFVHSCITGTWAVCCFYQKPEMAEDLIKTSTPLGHTLISVSVGYFVYDVIDMLIYQRTRQTYELLLHHAVIIVCFAVAIVTKLYVGYAVVALLVELNSIFLHMRQLLQICGFQKDNQFYRLNSIVNLGTFVGCRIATLAWMTRWIVINKNLIPLVFYSLGSMGLALTTVMNIILFYRLLRSDFLKKRELQTMDQPARKDD